MIYQMYMVVKLHFFVKSCQLPNPISYQKLVLIHASILKMSENKVKLMHSVYSFFLEFFRI